MSLSFTVPGPPRGKGRPRARAAGKFVQIYTDAKTASYENLVKLAASEALAGREPLDGPLDMTITIRFAPPVSTSAKNRAAMLVGAIRPAKKPDVDNTAKVVADACNGLAFHDDAQIVGLFARKIYAPISGVDVRLEAAGEQP